MCCDTAVVRDGSSTIWIQTQKPFFLLIVGHDVHKRGGPLGAIGVLELLEQDLDGLAVGRVHSDQMNAFGIL